MASGEKSGARGRFGRVTAHRTKTRPIDQYFLGEISAEDYLQSIRDETHESADVKESRARFLQICNHVSKLLDT